MNFGVKFAGFKIQFFGVWVRFPPRVRKRESRDLGLGFFIIGYAKVQHSDYILTSGWVSNDMFTER